ncbi:uncharacterized protein LOC143291116 [Babylonia areolata]|uniref:uncharacterized protein LOC143291116 n=1 Tax=Babylonia areolata TaxID=304850 RepID=UPI003FCF0313
MKLVHSDFEDMEASGSLGDDSDVILSADTMTSTQTFTPPPVTTLLSSILTDVVKTTTTTITSSATSVVTSTTLNATASATPSIMTERLYIFVGVLLALVLLAISIVVYVKCVHEKRPDTNTNAFAAANRY